jgi:hypothetical protein
MSYQKATIPAGEFENRNHSTGVRKLPKRQKAELLNL